MSRMWKGGEMGWVSVNDASFAMVTKLMQTVKRNEQHIIADIQTNKA